MISLRRRLFIMLVVATGIIWMGAAGWVYFRTKGEIEHVLDARLQEAARMVDSLATNGDIARAPDGATHLLRSERASYQRQLACQIWSLDGHLVARSSSAPNASLTDRPAGFSDPIVDGERWRVYAIENPVKGIRVLVGDRLGLRERLVTDLMKGLMAPAVLIVPLLGLLIWAVIGRGLRPLWLMAKELQARSADDMSPIDTQGAPTEIRPVADALSGLFAKLDHARRHEREVTAFAAHELRTPLAGLKTQAQIAIAATDPVVKEGALRQILIAVDRTTRLVRQLLALTRLDAGSDLSDTEDICVGQFLNEMTAALKPISGNRSIEIDPDLANVFVCANRELVDLALRNLHENALVHTPDHGSVRWGFAADQQILFIEDDGPGIPEEELPLVTRRFFRGRHKRALGSGLGLAIVDLALQRMHADLRLRNGAKGLRAEIVLPLRKQTLGPIHGTAAEPGRVLAAT